MCGFARTSVLVGVKIFGLPVVRTAVAADRFILDSG